MKRFLALCLISGTALAQSSRYDANAWTAATNFPTGAQAPMYTIPFAQIQICTDSSCATPVNVYLDQAKTQLITQPFQADAFGKYGFWAAPGTYWYNACSLAGDCDSGWLTVGGMGSGAGSVTSVSAGNLAPLFTSSVANATTTPNISFTLSQAANFTLYGNFAGAAAAPQFWSLVCGANIVCTTSGTTLTLTGSATARGWSCQTGIGDGANAIPANTYLQTFCRNDTGSTITLTAIRCVTDSGSSTCNAKNGAGTALLTGAITGSATYATGTQSTTTTLAAGDYLLITYVADGTTKQIGLDVAGTY